MVVDATLFLWNRCKSVFQRVQTGASDSGKYLQKIDQPNKVSQPQALFAINGDCVKTKKNKQLMVETGPEKPVIVPLGCF